MVFYADLDPSVVTRACENQPYGFQCLIAILRGFTQNCCIIDRNGEISGALAKRVGELRGDSDRKTLGDILEWLKKHSRFVEDPEDADVIINESTTPSPAAQQPGRPESCALANYQFTEFEHERSLSAFAGVTLPYGLHSNHEFMDAYFGKALRHAQRLTICDGSLGENFNANYKLSVGEFIPWLRGANLHGQRCSITFKCCAPLLKRSGVPRKEWQADHSRLAEVRAFFAEQDVAAEFYRFLPHDRFILTDQFALEIGRGMDFLNHDGRNRDVSIATKNVHQIKKLLGAYTKHLLQGC